MSKERRVTLHVSANEIASGESDYQTIDGITGCAYLDITQDATGNLDVDIEEYDFETEQWYTAVSFPQASTTGAFRVDLPACFSNRLRVKWTESTPGSPGWTFAVSVLTKETDR